MRIEDITKAALEPLTDSQLKNLRFRCVQLWQANFHGNDSEQAGGLSRSELLAKYVTLRHEMKRRGCDPRQQAALDKEVAGRLVKRAIWSLDVPGLSDVVLIDGYACIGGDYVRDPRGAADVAVVVKAKAADAGMEGHLAAILKAETGKDVRFIYQAEGPDCTHLPLYDLVLRPKADTRKVEVAAAVEKKLTPAQQAEYDAESARIAENSKKPEAKQPHKFQRAKWTHPNGHPRCLVCGDEEPIGGTCNVTPPPGPPTELDAAKAAGPQGEPAVPPVGTPAPQGEKPASEPAIGKAGEPIAKPETTASLHRLPVQEPGPGHTIRTKVLSEEQGISALYDVEAKAIITYLFDRDKWEMADAKEWVENKVGHPIGKALEPPEEYREFRITKVQAEQRIVGGVVYEPMALDTQGDYADAEEIGKAMVGFMERYSDSTSRIKVMHQGQAYKFPVVECFQPEVDTRKGSQVIKAGSWYMAVRVTDNGIWEAIKAGKITGFSMGGVAVGQKAPMPKS